MLYECVQSGQSLRSAGFSKQKIKFNPLLSSFDQDRSEDSSMKSIRSVAGMNYGNYERTILSRITINDPEGIRSCAKKSDFE